MSDSLSLQFARSGVSVLGLDLDSKKVDSINKGKTYLKHFSSESIAEQVNEGRFEATTNSSRISEVEAILICVPTPLNEYREPDLSFVLDTAEVLAPHLPKGVLVTLESTTYPGTTEDELRVVLENGSNMIAGKDFHLAYSPEEKIQVETTHLSKRFPKLSVDTPKNVRNWHSHCTAKHWTRFIGFLPAEQPKPPSYLKIFSEAST